MGGFPFGRRPKVLLASSLFGREAPVVRREAPVLLPAEVGFPFGRRPKVLLASSLSGCEAPVVRREAPVLLPAVGGFPFGRRPKVCELFVRAQSARSQARSVGELFVRARTACVIARHRRVSIRPKAERFSRSRRVLCFACVIPTRRRALPPLGI